MFLPQTILKIRSESSKSFMQFNISCHSQVIRMQFVCHSYVNRMYSYATHMSFAYHLHVLVYHSYVTPMCS